MDEPTTRDLNARHAHSVGQNRLRHCACGLTFRGRGLTRCEECRAGYRGQFTAVNWRQCDYCETWFIRRDRRQRYHDRECVVMASNRRRGIAPSSKECPRCGGTTSHPLKLCPPCRLSVDRVQRQRESDRHRAKRYGTTYEPISRIKVYRRDGWVCGICGDAIDPEAKWPDQWCASLDHVIPMSKGGPHTYANVQASHWWCNSVKCDDESFSLSVA